MKYFIKYLNFNNSHIQILPSLPGFCLQATRYSGIQDCFRSTLAQSPPCYLAGIPWATRWLSRLYLFG